MAGSLSLDDKLLGEKMHYYCSSSSEDEYESCDEAPAEETASTNAAVQYDTAQFSGPATNTGPKGVINDWRRFKQLETERRIEQENELAALQKKLSITCRSHLNDKEEDEKDEELFRELEELDDEFLEQYRKQRLEEMRKLFRDLPKYGSLTDLSSADEFLDATENTHPLTVVIVHVYEPNVDACITMDGCLQCLSKDYKTVKFCRIPAHKAMLSSKFSEEGVPALLVYKKGELIGNLVALRDSLGNDFFADEVEQLLLSHSLLPPKNSPEQVLVNVS